MIGNQFAFSLLSKQFSDEGIIDSLASGFGKSIETWATPVFSVDKYLFHLHKNSALGRRCAPSVFAKELKKDLVSKKIGGRTQESNQ